MDLSAKGNELKQPYPELKPLLQKYASRYSKEHLSLCWQECYWQRHSFRCMGFAVGIALLAGFILVLYFYIKSMQTWQVEILLLGLECVLIYLVVHNMLSEEYLYYLLPIIGVVLADACIMLYRYEPRAQFYRFLDDTIVGALSSLWDDNLEIKTNLETNVVTCILSAKVKAVDTDSTYSFSLQPKEVYAAMMVILKARGFNVEEKENALNISLTLANKVRLVFWYKYCHHPRVMREEVVAQLQDVYARKYQEIDAEKKKKDAEIAAYEARSRQEQQEKEERARRQRAERAREEEEERRTQEEIAAQNIAIRERKRREREAAAPPPRRREAL